MTFDFANPHTWYVIAAYGLALLAYGGLVIHATLQWRATHKRLKARE